jgi:ABC-type amino acid transport substrate-binding protein
MRLSLGLPRRCGWATLLLPALALGLMLAGMAPSRGDTIDTLKQRKVIYLGIRADQPPFSQIGADGVPTGYAISLCGEIVQGLRDGQNIPDLTVKYVTVSADSRFDDLASGKVDLLCEGTSLTIQRMQKFDFTLQTWVSGVTLMTRSELAIGNIKDLEGRRVGVVGSTTTEGLVRATLQRLLVSADVITYASHTTALKALLDKKVDAYFGDRDTLAVMRQQSKEPTRLKIADEPLSLELYALALRKDDDRLRLAANLTLSRLYRSAKIQEIFRTYFPGAEPSSLLKAMYILQGVPEL